MEWNAGAWLGMAFIGTRWAVSDWDRRHGARPGARRQWSGKLGAFQSLFSPHRGCRDVELDSGEA